MQLQPPEIRHTGRPVDWEHRQLTDDGDGDESELHSSSSMFSQSIASDHSLHSSPVEAASQQAGERQPAKTWEVLCCLLGHSCVSHVFSAASGSKDRLDRSWRV
ncbi:hypothetical protein ABBQ38_007189 [Trebouxia sp. C0009 RCD-2024]